MNNVYDQWANRVYLQWHLTNRCLNRCTHCYQNNYNGVEVAIQEAIVIIEDLVDCCTAFEALPVVALTGGDPMLNNDFWKILSEVRKQSPFACLSVLGNPEQLDAQTIQKLQPFQLHHFQLSVDGIVQSISPPQFQKSSFHVNLQ
ncbi:MAG: radical SAM protein [Bacteroidales bacterium]|jgi:MoaA/NifB/PqqE/SkfB family radical SAM enzyme